MDLLRLPNKIPTTDLENVFAEQLKSFVFSADAIAEDLAEVDTVTREKRDLLETLRSEEESVRTEAEKLYRLYLEGGLSVQGFREKNDPLEKRRGELAAEIPRLQGEIDFLAIRQLGSAEALAEAQTLYERWTDLPFEDRREIVETIVGRITVGKGDVEIELGGMPYALPSETAPDFPSSLELMAEGEQIHIPAYPFCYVTERGRKPREGYPAGAGLAIPIRLG